jgi:hypothetical protein
VAVPGWCQAQCLAHSHQKVLVALVELLQSKELSEVGHQDHLVVDLV